MKGKIAYCLGVAFTTALIIAAISQPIMYELWSLRKLIKEIDSKVSRIDATVQHTGHIHYHESLTKKGDADGRTRVSEAPVRD